MKIIVQKFGGTSVKDDRGRKLALSHIQEAVNEGYKAVVVVSAMGRKGDPYATDSLLDLLYGGQDTITEREQRIRIAFPAHGRYDDNRFVSFIDRFLNMV